MMYVVAIIIPWLALFLVGKWLQAILNLIIWSMAGGAVIFTLGAGSIAGGPIWLLCVVHAVWAVAKSRKED